MESTFVAPEIVDHFGLWIIMNKSGRKVYGVKSSKPLASGHKNQVSKYKTIDKGKGRFGCSFVLDFHSCEFDDGFLCVYLCCKFFI